MRRPRPTTNQVCRCGRVSVKRKSDELVCHFCDQADSQGINRARDETVRTWGTGNRTPPDYHAIPIHDVSLPLHWWKIADSYGLY